MKIKQYPGHKKSKIENPFSVVPAFATASAEKALRRMNRKSKVGGSVLVLVAVAVVMMAVLGLAMLKAASGVRHRAMILKNETAAMLAAEAGYEKAVFEMGKQLDMLSALHKNVPEMNDTLSLPGGSFDYQIGLYTFVKSCPVYEVISNGHSGVFSRTVDAYVIQAVSGWDMGQCRVLGSGTTTTAVNFITGEVIVLPIHINKYADSPDVKDIYISGTPQFKKEVAMGESQYTTGGSDKYSGVMGLFEGGIVFNQPDCRITDPCTVQMKVDRFRTTTDNGYNFSDDTGQKPVAALPATIPNPQPAVQLEFFEAGGVGKVQIINNCTVRGFEQSSDSRTYDFMIKPKTTPQQAQRYYIYAYHYKPNGVTPPPVNISATYVSQSFGGVSSEKAGQIFVDGDVVIGGSSGPEVVKGKITIVATGNIWIANSIKVSDYDDSGVYHPRDSNGMPAEDNPNILGLISQGVIKVVDPGMSEYSSGGTNGYPGPPTNPSGYVYVPIGQPDPTTSTTTTTTSGTTTTTSWSTTTTSWSTTTTAATTTTTTTTTVLEVWHEHLQDPMVVEASMVLGGGGWGAENVQYSSYGGRKEWAGSDVDGWDKLTVRGTIVERCRAVVGRSDITEGYKKNYWFDTRVLQGILPGDIWLQGKYVPAPAGWHDKRE